MEVCGAKSGLDAGICLLATLVIYDESHWLIGPHGANTAPESLIGCFPYRQAGLLLELQWQKMP
jgi:hypothetical protein